MPGTKKRASQDAFLLAELSIFKDQISPMMPNWPVILMLCGLCLGCSGRKNRPEDKPLQQVHFGKGGGFSGEVKKYVLLESGQLIGQSSLRPGEVAELKFIKKGLVRKIMASAKAMDCDTVKSPGNMYCFLMVYAETDTCSWVWPQGGPAPSEETSMLYQQCMDLVPETP